MTKARSGEETKIDGQPHASHRNRVRVPTQSVWGPHALGGAMQVGGRLPGGGDVGCTAVQTAVALRQAARTATTSTEDTPRRWLPPAGGCARLLICSTSSTGAPNDGSSTEPPGRANNVRRNCGRRGSEPQFDDGIMSPVTLHTNRGLFPRAQFFKLRYPVSDFGFVDPPSRFKRGVKSCELI
jgi:hypothetical protein